jgi:LCP family protein required for cell wall assembly
MKNNSISLNKRLFFITLSLTMFVSLFLVGIWTLYHISSDANEDTTTSPGTVWEMIADFKNNEKEQVVENDNGSFNLLVIGGDNISKNADTMIILNVNTKENSIVGMSIPRDTKAKIRGHYEKINGAFPKGGIELTKTVIQDTFNITIDKYMFFDTKIFKYVIDELGGVKYYVPIDMHYDDPIQDLHIHLKKGYQVLNGDKAEQFMRFRKYNHTTVNNYYDGSDLKRIDAQQNFIKEFIKQKTNLKSLTKLNSLLNIILKNVETDLSFSDILKLLRNTELLNKENFYMFKLPGVPLEKTPWFYLINKKKTSAVVEYYFSGKIIEDFKVDKYINDNSLYKLNTSDFDENDLISYNSDEFGKESEENPSNGRSDIESSGIESGDFDLSNNPSNAEYDIDSSGVETLRLPSSNADNDVDSEASDDSDTDNEVSDDEVATDRDTNEETDEETDETTDEDSEDDSDIESNSSDTTDNDTSDNANSVENKDDIVDQENSDTLVDEVVANDEIDDSEPNN